MIDQSVLEMMYGNTAKRKTVENLLKNTPSPVTPVITQSDVLRKYFTRYFVRPTSDKTRVMEIDESQYMQFKENPIYVTTQIKWKIVGKQESDTTPYGARIYGVKDTNIKTVSVADLTFGGLTRYIRDYLEFWFSED